MDPIAPIRHRTRAELDAGLDDVRHSPRDVGTLDLIVRRPTEDAREMLAEAELTFEAGVVGDNWAQRPSSRTSDGAPPPDTQLNVINSRFAALIAGPERAAWALAGDQLYLDLDLSQAALPVGSRVAIGTQAVIEVTAPPHTGCAKFAARFGREAHKAVWTEEGTGLRLRGLNARVVVPGTIRAGDPVRVLRVHDTPEDRPA